MVARKSYTNNGSYQIKSDTKYLNDGWWCLAEVNGTNNNVIRAYVWGLDLSGSLEGAGGIGGLLMLTHAATSTSHFYAYDGNGNVSAMAKTSDSSKTAHCEYGPFGEVTRASGTVAKSNCVRFSTKAQDEESDLFYYGYRFYDASTGRWPNRDRIQERGGRNLYGFSRNDPVVGVDILGIKPRYATVASQCLLQVSLDYSPSFHTQPPDQSVVERLKDRPTALANYLASFRPWTPTEMDAWKETAQTLIQGYFNGLNIRCKTKDVCTRCPNGIRVEVASNMSGGSPIDVYKPFIDSTACGDGATGCFVHRDDRIVVDQESNSFQLTLNGTHSVLLHEVGHQLGLGHPGTERDHNVYSADPGSIMGNEGWKLTPPDGMTAFCSKIDKVQFPGVQWYASLPYGTTE